MDARRRGGRYYVESLEMKLGEKQIDKIFLTIVNAYGSLKIETGSPLSRWKNSSA
jgi:hypothetical protein